MHHLSAFNRASQAVSLIGYYTELLESATLEPLAQSLIRFKISQWRALRDTRKGSLIPT